MRSKWHGATCPECGRGTLHDGTRPQIVEYRGARYESQQTGAFCDNCGDGMVTDDPAEEARWEKFRNQVNTQQAQELAAIRARLNLTQEQASAISGGGHNAFSRYERQEAQPVLGVVNLFRALNIYPDLVGRFLPELANVRSTTSTGPVLDIVMIKPERWARRANQAFEAPLELADTGFYSIEDDSANFPIARVPKQPAPVVRTVTVEMPKQGPRDLGLAALRKPPQRKSARG